MFWIGMVAGVTLCLLLAGIGAFLNLTQDDH